MSTKDHYRMLYVVQIALDVPHATPAQVAECDRLINEMQDGPDKQTAIEHMEMIGCKQGWED